MRLFVRDLSGTTRTVEAAGVREARVSGTWDSEQATYEVARLATPPCLSLIPGTQSQVSPCLGYTRARVHPGPENTRDPGPAVA